MAITIEKQHILVVEGKDDEAFFGEIGRYLHLDQMQTLGIGGKQKLRESLKALVAAPKFGKVKAIGVIRDADQNPSAAFQSVRDSLLAAGLHAPHQPNAIEGNNPCVAVMIMPQASMPGMLEDLCLSAVSQDPAFMCVEQYFQCLEEQVGILPGNPAKARVQAFLASRPKAGLRLGEAARAGFWPWDSPAFAHVREFLSLIGGVAG